MISPNSLPTHGAIFRRVALLSVIGTAGAILAQTAALPPREPAASLAPSFARLHDSTRNRGTAPYDVLERAELRQSGYSTIVGALQAELPTVNQPHPAIDDGTAHLPPFTVRGLSPDHTQVLVNGHPRHATALLNVNGTIGRGSVTTALMSLPMAALDHLEVLRDGSDARFGSGAMAGVINVQLREEIDRRTLVLFGRTAEGDGEVKQVAFEPVVASAAMASSTSPQSGATAAPPIAPRRTPASNTSAPVSLWAPKPRCRATSDPAPAPLRRASRLIRARRRWIATSRAGAMPTTGNKRWC